MNCRNHIIISIDVEESLDKIQHPFDLKNSQRIVFRGNIPQHNKGHI